MAVSAEQMQALFQGLAGVMSGAMKEAIAEAVKVQKKDWKDVQVDDEKGKRIILDPKGYDGVETFAGGEEGWNIWKWK